MLLLTAAWTFCGVLVHVWAPLAAPFLLLLSFLAPAAWVWLQSGRHPLYRPSPIFLALAFAGIYLLLNASRSISPSSGYAAVGIYLSFIGVLQLALPSLQNVETAPLRAMAIGLLMAVVVGGAVVCFEALSHQWLHRQLMYFAPWFRPDPRHMMTEGTIVTFLQPYLLNRNITVLTLLLWPAVFFIFLVVAPGRRLQWLAALVPVVAAIFYSRHATSKIAFVGAAATFGAIQFWPAGTKRVITWAWVASILLVVPLVAVAYHGGLYLSAWLPHSAQHRIVIWGHTSEQIAKAPILGAGINAARMRNDASDFDVRFAPGSDIPLTTGWHSHNAYLQTWYEGGAVGAVVLLGIGLMLLRSLAASPPHAQPYIYATFVACMLIGASSFSLWQPWFLATFGFVAAFTTLGCTLARRGFGRDLLRPRGAVAS